MKALSINQQPHMVVRNHIRTLVLTTLALSAGADSLLRLCGCDLERLAPDLAFLRVVGAVLGGGEWGW